MRAIRMDELGGPEVLRPVEVPDPVPADGQVLVEVEWANVTFVETQLRAGTGPFQLTPPVIPGNGVGGTVAGTARRVVASLGGRGGYAERAAVDEANLIDVPDGVPLDVATALLADGRTALLLAGAAAIRPGEHVLVEAAAGGVGTLLVQLALRRGATVTAAAGGDAKLAIPGQLGAHHLVDYRRPGWTDAVDEVDVVFDGVGGEVGRAAAKVLRAGGRFVSFGLASGEWAGVDGALTPSGTPEELRALSRQALELAADGTWSPVIGQRLPLERAADAHAAIEQRRTIGKTLLRT